MRIPIRMRAFRLSTLAIWAALVSLLAACSNSTMAYSSNMGGGPPYKVTYANTTVATTGSVPVDPTLYAAGSTVTVLGNTGPLVWAGFTFTGWDSRDDGGLDGGGGGTFYSPGASFTIDSNVTLYGTWTSGP